MNYRVGPRGMDFRTRKEAILFGLFWVLSVLINIIITIHLDNLWSKLGAINMVLSLAATSTTLASLSKEKRCN